MVGSNGWLDFAILRPRDGGFAWLGGALLQWRNDSTGSTRVCEVWDNQRPVVIRRKSELP